jgi:YesN/AraC family two-component response regulator
VIKIVARVKVCNFLEGICVRNKSKRGNLPARIEEERTLENCNGKNRSKNGKELCDSVVARILDCPVEDLKTMTVGSLAKEFRVSKIYLHRCFKFQRDTTPGRFLSRHKMQRARSLMEKNGRLTVRQVAEILGYSTPDYFIRVFKKYFGRPPCQYRDFSSKQDEKI